MSQDRTGTGPEPNRNRTGPEPIGRWKNLTAPTVEPALGTRFKAKLNAGCGVGPEMCFASVLEWNNLRRSSPNQRTPHANRTSTGLGVNHRTPREPVGLNEKNLTEHDSRVCSGSVLLAKRESLDFFPPFQI